MITFYNPQNPVAGSAVALAREAAEKLGIELIERHVASAAEMESAVRAMKRGEVDAHLLAGDAMVVAATPGIADLLRERKLPTFSQHMDFIDSCLATFPSRSTTARSSRSICESPGSSASRFRKPPCWVPAT